MVLEILRGSTKPPVCVVEPLPGGDFTVRCDVTKETARLLIDKEKVCVIEWRDGKPFSYCGPGKEVVTRIFL